MIKQTEEDSNELIDALFGFLIVFVFILIFYTFLQKVRKSFEAKVCREGIETIGYVSKIRRGNSIGSKSSVICVSYCDIYDDAKCSNACFNYMNTDKYSMRDSVKIKYLLDDFYDPLLTNRYCNGSN